jgi:hypothetical protein
MLLSVADVATHLNFHQRRGMTMMPLCSLECRFQTKDVFKKLCNFSCCNFSNSEKTHHHPRTPQKALYELERKKIGQAM